MSNVAESFEHNGYTVEIHVDEDAYDLNPRNNDGNLFLFLGLPHRSYTIGDEVFDPALTQRECEHCQGTGEEPGTEHERDKGSAVILRGVDCTVCQGEGNVNPCEDPETRSYSFSRIIAFLKAEHESPYVVPVGMIDHSGVSYYLGGGPHWSDSQGWDSGTCGFMVLLPDRVKEGMGADYQVTEEWAREAAESELKEYDSWASGDVYAVVITDINGDVVESCSGMIGFEYAQQSAREIAEGLGEPPAKLHTLRLTDVDLDAIEHALTGYALSSSNGSDYVTALEKILTLR